jgi:hypothetical protein
LNSGTTWASFNFSGKMELFIDLFIKFVIGWTIAGFANFRSFAEMPYQLEHISMKDVLADQNLLTFIQQLNHFQLIRVVI